MSQFVPELLVISAIAIPTSSAGQAKDVDLQGTVKKAYLGRLEFCIHCGSLNLQRLSRSRYDLVANYLRPTGAHLTRLSVSLIGSPSVKLAVHPAKRRSVCLTRVLLVVLSNGSLSVLPAVRLTGCDSSGKPAGLLSGRLSC